MAILTSEQYEAVRKAIDTSLEEDDLPDEVIELDLYAGAAERWLIRRDPNALTRTGSELAIVTTAAVLYCASLLVVAIPRLTQEDAAGVAYSRQHETPDVVADRLRGRAEAALAEVLTPAEITPGRPTMFALARGRRGR